LDERLDLFAIKRQLERGAEIVQLGDLVSDLGFVLRARRALLPLPVIDRWEEIDADEIFPPFDPCRRSKANASPSSPPEEAGPRSPS
jgi:hypothetical protein